MFDDSRSPFTKWFVGGRLNACYNAVDRHVERGFSKKVAIIHDSPITNTVRHVTYEELYDQVARLAGGLRKLGVGKGDRVVIYMPLIPEAIMAMLAVVRLGAVHSVVFGGRWRQLFLNHVLNNCIQMNRIRGQRTCHAYRTC